MNPTRLQPTSSPAAIAVCFTLGVLLASCAASGRGPAADDHTASVAARWHAPLPHDGQLADLSRWWSQFDDPLLLQLIEASQRVSANLAQAGARLANARAARVTARATLLPTLDATAGASRGRQEPGAPLITTGSAGLQASWELDLFGANRAGARAAEARLASNEAGWHDARVALAAEVAHAYLSLRACEAQRVQAELDAASRDETARLTELATQAGMQAPAAAELALASAAQGRATLMQQQAQCERGIKALVALTAFDEPDLRHRLTGDTARLPQPAALAVAAVPAEALAQRPDVAAAAYELIAVSADADQAQAERWPRITLTGNIGGARQAADGVTTDGRVWSIGPVNVTLPLFDGGVRRSRASAAQARHGAARVAYAASLRTAVREVETALVDLHGATARGSDAHRAVQGYERSFAAVEVRYRGGLASLFELEDARRSLVAARSVLIEQQRERIGAWITLYRALGGGWRADPHS
jgi:NodT family efflux transporter outer membrane factor (OMF) lipoprotein